MKWAETALSSSFCISFPILFTPKNRTLQFKLEKSLHSFILSMIQRLTMKAKAFCLHVAFILLSKFWITQNITYICSIQNHSINSMDFATTFFVVLAIIGVGMVLWIKTNSGKKWLSNL